MYILFRRSASKKGSVLMSVMCIMTFIIILATISITVTSGAHQNVVYENKIQQAYYTAKSAADSTAQYISASGGADENAMSGSIAKKLFDVYTAYNADTTADWTAGVNYIAGEDMTSSVGDYKVDIYPTTNILVFKIVASSEYQGITGSAALLMGPKKSGTGLDDALVSTGALTLGGSPLWQGGICANQSELKVSSSYLGGSICNNGNVVIDTQNGMNNNHFEEYLNNGGVLRIVAKGSVSLPKVYCSYDGEYGEGKDDKVSIFNYYSYFVSSGDMNFKGWSEHDDKLIKPGVLAKSAKKGIFCGGNFNMDGSSYGADFYMPFYIKGNMNINASGKVTINGDVYVKGNLSTNADLRINGKLVVGGTINSGGKSVTISGNASTNAGATFDAKTKEYEDQYAEELEYASNATKYGDWQFTPEQYAAMMGNFFFLDDKKSGSSYNHSEIVNDSGTILSLTSSSSGQREGGFVFDTNIYTVQPTYDASGKMVSAGTPSGKYKDLYLQLGTSVNLDKRPSFETWGRGNVYILIPDGVTWRSSACAMYCRDFPNEAHLYFISNEITTNTVIDFGTLNDTQTRQGNTQQWLRKNTKGGNTTAYFYMYCPNAKVKVTGSSGFAGAIISKYPEVDSGANQSNIFVQPVDSSGNKIGINGVVSSSSLSVLLRSRN